MDSLNVRPAAPQPPAAPSAAPAQTKKPKNKKFRAKAVVISLVVLALLAATGFLYWQNVQAQKKLQQYKDPAAAAKAETDELLKEVSKIVELPGGETPTVATVVDAAKLKDQEFFAKAANGDKVLMYTSAKKAYLYRPSTKKIIEVAPINVGTPEAKR